MKNLLLFGLLLPVIFATGQTIDEVAYNILGTSGGNNSDLWIDTEYGSFKINSANKKMIDTKYGSFTFKLRTVNGVCGKIIITLTNGQHNYKEIIENSKDCQVKVGTLWTDLIYSYTPIETKKFKTLEKAKEYYNSIDKTKYRVYEELHIYKQPKKEKYIVGIFNIEYPEYGEILRKSSDGKKFSKDYQIVK